MNRTLRVCLLAALVIGLCALPIGTAGELQVKPGQNTDRAVSVRGELQLSSSSSIANPKLSGTMVSVLYAPSQVDDAPLRSTISGITGAPADYWDARVGTPALVDLQLYGCVFTWVDSSYADATAMGDVLADYADWGGVVVLGAFTTYTSGNSLAGRIMTSTYSPAYSPTGSNLYTTLIYNGDGTSYLWDAVASYQTDYPDDIALQGAGVADGTLGTGVMAAAYRPDFHVVFLNGAGGTNGSAQISGGDTGQLVANACSLATFNTRAGIPALGRTGILILIGLLTLAAALLLRRTS